MPDFFHSIISAILSSALAVGALGWFLKTWLDAHIKGAIEHDYGKRMAEYENKIEMRARAQLIAELLAEWMDSPVDEPMSSNQRKRLNQLSFEASLWLPEKIATDLSKVLQHHPDAPNQFELILRVREHLSGPHGLTPKEITQWSREKELPNVGLPEGFTHGQICVFGVVEKFDGSTTDISEEDLKRGFTPQSGSTISLQVKKQKSKVVVETGGIEYLKLVSNVSVPNGKGELVLQVHPKELADDINRRLFTNEQKTAVEGEVDA